jgi:N-acyl-phosphatidylethanolamine-hydrolysing phospholipase D
MNPFTWLFKMLSSWSSWSGSTPTNSRPSHHTNDTRTAFQNPWPSAEKPTWAELLQSKFPLGWYEDLAKKHPGTRDVKVVVPDWGAASLRERGLARDKCIVGTTLGHAGVITELPLEGTAKGDGKKKSFWVVYDPIFSLRAGPTQYTGPQRLRQPPCQVTDLPGM